MQGGGETPLVCCSRGIDELLHRSGQLQPLTASQHHMISAPATLQHAGTHAYFTKYRAGGCGLKAVKETCWFLPMKAFMRNAGRAVEANCARTQRATTTSQEQ